MVCHLKEDEVVVLVTRYILHNRCKKVLRRSGVKVKNQTPVTLPIILASA